MVFLREPKTSTSSSKAASKNSRSGRAAMDGGALRFANPGGTMAEYGKQTPQTPSSRGSGNTSGYQGSPSTQGTQKQNVNEATERVAEKAQSTFENARSKVTEQLSAVSRAIEKATDTLEQEQQAGLSKKLE